MAVPYYGDFPTGHTGVIIPFNTFDSNDPSASVTIGEFANTDVHIHKNGSLTQRASASGVAIDIDVDGITGCHWITIDLSDNTDAGFYAAGSEINVRIEGTTVDGATINAFIGSFSIERAGGALALLKHGTYGLAALETLVDDLETGVAAIPTNPMPDTENGSSFTALPAVTLANGAHGGAAASITLADYSAFKATGFMLSTENGSSFTAVPWNAAWDAEVQSECTDALNAYDPPTNAEMVARTLLAASYSTLTAANVNAEVVDALNVDTYAEPGQEAPGSTVSLAAKIGYLFKAWRNKKTSDGATKKLYADDGVTVDQKATLSDAGGTYTDGEWGTGP